MSSDSLIHGSDLDNSEALVQTTVGKLSDISGIKTFIFDNEIGNIIDSDENKRYHLFTPYPGFRYAYIQINADGTFTSVVVASRGGRDQIVEQILRTQKDIDAIKNYLKKSEDIQMASTPLANYGGEFLFGMVGFSTGIFLATLINPDWENDEEPDRTYDIKMVFLPLLPIAGANIGINSITLLTDDKTAFFGTVKGSLIGAAVGVLLTNLMKPKFEESYSDKFTDKAFGAFSWDQAYPWLLTGPSVVIGGIIGYNWELKKKSKAQIEKPESFISFKGKE